MTGPLTGLRVVELAGLGPAPFATMTLAGLGADVICVDRPGNGPDPRTDLLNRGKRSIVMDLKDPDAVATVLDLIATADVLVEGFRPGVTERLGLGPAAALARNPRLVYARMTGWGQDGPRAQSAGRDLDYIAITGALHAVGPAGGAPQIPLNLVGDFGAGGTYLVIGILAALHETGRTGRGQVVDAAIVDGTVNLLAIVHGFLADDRWRDERGVNLLDGGAPFYAVYATGDGGHVAVGALEPKFYAELLRFLDLDGTLDPADQYRPETWDRTRRELESVFATRSRQEWTDVFAGTDACVAPVLGLREAADEPHLQARASLLDVDGVLQPNVAPRFGAHPDLRPGRAPRRGEHTAQVLDELYGRSRPSANPLQEFGPSTSSTGPE